MRLPVWFGPLVMAVGTLIWPDRFWLVVAAGIAAVGIAILWPIMRHHYLVRSISHLVAELPSEVAALVIALSHEQPVALASAQIRSLAIIRRLGQLERSLQALGLNGGLAVAIAHLREAVRLVTEDGQIDSDEATELLDLTHRVVDAYIVAVYREAQARPIWQVSSAVRRGLASALRAR